MALPWHRGWRPGLRQSYGLIETAKACGLEPCHYLRRIFTDLSKARTLEDFEAPLPAVWLVLPMNLASDPTLRRSGT